MAKKNLINADMLLATPRKTVLPIEIVVEEPAHVALEPQPTLPLSEETEPVASVKRGLKGNETRATFIVDENLLEKLKAIAYWERLNIKEVINDMILNYLEGYEKHKGAIKSIPNNRKS